MQKFVLDYQDLSNTIDKKAYRLADVKDKLVKVAFDIVKFRDNDAAGLWQIQSADDGEYIVALYKEEEPIKEASSQWEVLVSKASLDLNFYYKGEPIVKMASHQLGIPSDELKFVEKYLPKKLASNKNLVNSLLKQLNEKTRFELLRKYPELS